jgi:hypothetical protein
MGSKGSSGEGEVGEIERKRNMGTDGVEGTIRVKSSKGSIAEKEKV